ncbi:ABC transporter ATP-binding protein [Alkalihalobacillus sp. AL-G]|uniref:ABC transporter ATP-binding protein n=1 Tax=Alkalihalobacillus sp. AL-G TaxID=2926399 RepID=UPI00272C2412|nr:ATP-binding cassette domain-containing protein [Alkalihalobacillus sp. AL-G]WLD94575.1 ATP-binding cassette domain-containing protein [Alkalihalobacillus sp. AL-G]
MLQIDSVSKTFNSKGHKIHAVKNVRFSIQDEEVFALVGESGSGKSTLAHMIMRLEQPTSGNIHLNGKDIFSYPKRKYAKEVQMVFQNPDSSLNPKMTVEELIGEPLYLHNMPRRVRFKRVKILLEKVRLTSDVIDRFPAELSGGQKQRVAIARALALEPRLLVADEATSSLDVLIEREVIDLLRDLHKETGISILLISHNLEIVHSIADRVGVMHKGELLEEASTSQLFKHPQESYTRKLLEAIPISHPEFRKS